MELLRETAPFIVGLVVPPMLALIMPRGWQGRARFWGAFGAALVLGVIAAFLAGELFLDLPEAAMSIVIDTSLIFTASQVAYRLLWREVLANRTAARETVRR